MWSNAVRGGKDAWWTILETLFCCQSWKWLPKSLIIKSVQSPQKVSYVCMLSDCKGNASKMHTILYDVWVYQNFISKYASWWNRSHRFKTNLQKITRTKNATYTNKPADKINKFTLSSTSITYTLHDQSWGPRDAVDFGASPISDQFSKACTNTIIAGQDMASQTLQISQKNWKFAELYLHCLRCPTGYYRRANTPILVLILNQNRFPQIRIVPIQYKKDVLSQRWPRDARYISSRCGDMAILNIQDGGGRHLEFVRIKIARYCDRMSSVRLSVRLWRWWIVIT